MKWFILPVLSLFLVACTPNNTNQAETIFPAPLKDVDETAGLAILIDGIPLQLNKTIYTQQSETTYLDSKNPGIVHIKKSPLTWQDFFDSHVFELTEDCVTINTRSTYCSNDNETLKVFYNGDRVKTLGDKPLRQGDQVLISFGNQEGVEIQRQLNMIPKQP